MLKNIVLLMIALMTAHSGWADDGSFSLGWSPVFVNMVDRVSGNETRKTTVLGTFHPYVFQASYGFRASSRSVVEPFLATSLMPRKNQSGEIEEKLLLLGFRYAQNFGSSSSGGWDWSLGTGLWRSSVRGNGGQYVDPNGATYYNPDAEMTSQMIFTSAGLGYKWNHFKLGPELFLLDSLHNQKRSYNLMIHLLWRSGR